MKVGSTVLVLGAGPIGLVTLLTAKAFGPIKVIVLDLVEHRLKLAKQIGADDVFLIKKEMDDKQIIAKVIELMECEPSCCIDCVGVESTVRVAIQVVEIIKTVLFTHIY